MSDEFCKEGGKPEARRNDMPPWTVGRDREDEHADRGTASVARFLAAPLTSYSLGPRSRLRRRASCPFPPSSSREHNAPA